jgi:tRNA-dihydrouridine synthase C
MKLWLAPMEGVVDFIMRDFLTRMSDGSIDHCVTEFIRVTDKIVPDSVFLRYCPELKTQAKTAAGVPVAVQLLGGHAEPLAANALRAIHLGAQSIDLNFGCPAKTVNRHDGGATLLKYPQRLHEIVLAVRKAVPAHIPVSAKIRLGFDDPGVCVENARALASAGASWLTVHCRTKTQMYTPPAYWEWIPRIREAAKISIIGNGDIWNVEDLKRCQEITGCTDFMIGRGALRDPLIFQKIKGHVAIEKSIDTSRIIDFFALSSQAVSPHFAQARTKQWLRNMMSGQPSLSTAFNEIKSITCPTAFSSRLNEIFTSPDQS